MLWWYWITLGLILAMLELATPFNFFLVFFGVGGVIALYLSVNFVYIRVLGADGVAALRIVLEMYGDAPSA